MRGLIFFLSDSLFDMVVTATSFIKCEQHVVVTIKMSDRKKQAIFFKLEFKVTKDPYSLLSQEVLRSYR